MDLCLFHSTRLDQGYSLRGLTSISNSTVDVLSWFIQEPSRNLHSNRKQICKLAMLATPSEVPIPEGSILVPTLF